MYELKKQTIDIINQINQDWVEEVRNALKENRKPRSTEMMGKFSESMKKLDSSFREAEQRLHPSKKGMFKK